MGSTLIVGDIHGCYDELVKLIELQNYPETIISVGDVVDRGNQNVEVVNFINQYYNHWSHKRRFQVVRGNHENKHARGLIGPTQYLCKWEFGVDYTDLIDFISRTHQYYKSNEVFVIHAFYDYNLSLADHVNGRTPNIDDKRIWQSSEKNTGILYGHQYHTNELIRKYGKDYIWNWWQKVDFNVPLCFGHLKYDTPELIPNRVYALDGSVAQMGYLHGLLLPEMKVISVKNDRFDFANDSGFIYPELYSNPRIFFKGKLSQMEGVFTGGFEIKRNGELRLSQEYRNIINEIYDEILEERERLNISSDIINDILQKSKKQYRIRTKLKETMDKEHDIIVRKKMKGVKLK